MTRQEAGTVSKATPVPLPVWPTFQAPLASGDSPPAGTSASTAAGPRETWPRRTYMALCPRGPVLSVSSEQKGCGLWLLSDRNGCLCLLINPWKVDGGQEQTR